MCAANDDIEEVSHFEELAYIISIALTGVFSVHTAFYCSMASWQLQVASTNMCLVRWNTVPASRALLDARLA